MGMLLLTAGVRAGAFTPAFMLFAAVAAMVFVAALVMRPPRSNTAAR